MANAKWNYNGDVDLKEGGYFWRMDSPTDDFATAVEVTPESVIDGPNNVFMIETGSIYFNPETRKSALDCCGYEDNDELTIDMLVDAYKSYAGIECDGRDVIQIGPQDVFNDVSDWNPEQIRGNWKLKNYVKRNYL